MSRWLKGLGLWILVSLSSVVWAQDDHHYTVREPRSPVPVVELLNFERHNEPLPEPTEKYNRDRHYGSWIQMDGCLDTRAIVLIRDSKNSVQYTPGNKCRVNSGKWFDPYTGKTFTKASDMQIDHVVALKNSYISGAWKWDYKTRCLYANFLGNDFHLMSVYGRENLKKADKTPEYYMPPRKTFACQYLKNWLEIKLIWNLALSSSEAAAIKDLAQENNCSVSKMRTTLEQLLKNRQAIADNADLCQ